MALGLIDTASGNTEVDQWDYNLDHDLPPYDNIFYGTLGMSLALDTSTENGKDNPLYNIIAQLPGNLHTGFIIHADGDRPTMTIGLTPADVATFSTASLISDKNPPMAYPFGNGVTNGLFAYDDKGLKPTFKIGDIDKFKARVVFDTGEPNTVIYDDDIREELKKKHYFFKGDKELIYDLGFSMKLVPQISWGFQTGSLTNDNLVQSFSNNKNSVNTGIGFFFSYDVMYDMACGQLGFRTASYG